MSIYAQQSDIVEAWGSDELLLVANDGTGVIDATKVATALSRADARLDTALAAKYPLPLPLPFSPVLTQYAVDLSMYFLSTGPGRGLTEEKRKRYEDAVAELDKLARGITRLSSSTGVPDPPDNEASRIAMSADRRRMTLRNLGEVL